VTMRRVRYRMVVRELPVVQFPGVADAIGLTPRKMSRTMRQI